MWSKTTVSATLTWSNINDELAGKIAMLDHDRGGAWTIAFFCDGRYGAGLAGQYPGPSPDDPIVCAAG